MIVDRALIADLIPNRALFYGGGWHAPIAGGSFVSTDPATGKVLGDVPEGRAEDADAAIAAAKSGFAAWRKVAPLERAKILREAARIIRANIDDLALIDAADGGNPITKVRADVMQGADRFDFFAGLVTEMKGDTIPGRDGTLTFTQREPWGVVARIVAFNHPFMFTASRMAAPLAAGNACIVKPPEQASLSGLKLAELIGHLFPAGTFSILTGGRELGEALSSHNDVAMIGLVGSVPTGKAVMRAAAGNLKPVLLELGGKNALVAFPDADPDAVAEAMIDGMNFTWCGQSCGSTSRAFLHEDIHDAVVARVAERIAKVRPGLPLDPATTMGSLINRTQYDRVMAFIAAGREEGASLLVGGKHPEGPDLADGCFIEPTVFTGVTPDMRIAREEIFGPVLSVLKWTDENEVLAEVNALDLGLTCAIWTHDLATAHRMAAAVETGYVWINDVSKHFPGAPFGGYKLSGIGREESLGELFEFTQEKTIHVNFSGRR
ncbi:MAG TPA: aldehyde dehydrogenase family protein [Pelagibacterium sp.]|uniref:aldehyde dehydrogenase family protein n=1 Tax=Pelagibacterium sp. TaxID=1967288 RepID=UPI002BCDE5F5|nr:aldehyde dehydrogenase family protein [Pelagibacterium sp.]HWJ87956.1 aldehyde dehydrogenase family protein [Pelagibacterium sp.]